MSSHSHAYMVGAICRVIAISAPALRNRLLVRCFTEWKFRTYKESHVHCVNALRKVPTDLRMRYFGALACRFGEKAPQRMLHAVMVASDSSDDEDTRHNRPLFDLATRFMSHPLNMCVNNAFTEKAAEEFALGELASEQLTSEQLVEKATIFFELSDEEDQRLSERLMKKAVRFNDYMKYVARLFDTSDFVPGRDDSLLYAGSMAYLVNHTAFGKTTPIVCLDYFSGITERGVGCQLGDWGHCHAHDLICVDGLTKSCFVSAVMQLQKRFHIDQIRQRINATLHGLVVAAAICGTPTQSLKNNGNEISCRLANFLHKRPLVHSVGAADVDCSRIESSLAYVRYFRAERIARRL